MEQNQEQLYSLAKFPFAINGDPDEMPVLKLNPQQFEKIWPLLLQQENYDMNNNGKLLPFLAKTVFSKADAFAEQMIHTKSNSIANFNFEKINVFRN